MDIEQLHKYLDVESYKSTQRGELIDYLKTAIKTLPESKSDRSNFAYNVAGLLSTNFAQSLDSNDSLDNILTMAGELEIPNDYDGSKWEGFCNLINNLE